MFAHIFAHCSKCFQINKRYFQFIAFLPFFRSLSQMVFSFLGMHRKCRKIYPNKNDHRWTKLWAENSGIPQSKQQSEYVRQIKYFTGQIKCVCVCAHCLYKRNLKWFCLVTKLDNNLYVNKMDRCVCVCTNKCIHTECAPISNCSLFENAQVLQHSQQMRQSNLSIT